MPLLQAARRQNTLVSVPLVVVVVLVVKPDAVAQQPANDKALRRSSTFQLSNGRSVAGCLAAYRDVNEGTYPSNIANLYIVIVCSDICLLKTLLHLYPKV